ncbi:MAG: PLP-dependent aminotransferase family protein [Proteobacteria bacterium]|nr:PLP-dependent aminotransferase family protein [Pseudomonadota bacterium]
MAGARRSARRPHLELLLDPNSPLTLQHQVRQKLIDAMSHGVLRPGRRLPSSRALARQAGIARNTVTLAYDALLAAGHLVSRPRSGIFVAPQPPAGRVTTGRRGLNRPSGDPGRAIAAATGAGEFRRPPNWEQYPYPFLDGCIDTSLVAADEWREALRIAFGKRDLLRWGTATDPLDDARLNAELREQVLPAWGIGAAPDELLCAASARHALHLVIDCFAGRQTPVWVEASVDADTRRRLSVLQAPVTPFDLAAGGARLLGEVPSQSLIILGPRGAPDDGQLTRARAQGLLELAARTGSLIVECTAPPQVREPRRAPPALRAMTRHPRVLLIGTLAQVASLGSAPAFINGSAELIERLRESRRLSGGGVPFGLQRAWGYFIGLGHYAAATARASAVLQERRTALRDALNHHLHRFVSIRTRAGASAYWVRGRAQIDAAQLARSAATVGVLVEPVDAAAGLLCMGVTSIPKPKIREGVERLARLVRGDPRSGPGDLRQEAARVLRGRALRRAMAGVTLLYSTVYGEPCTIEVRADGELVGRAGYADEDRDVGRWWIEGDRWFRQWHSWAYGEVASFYTVLAGDQVRWFNAEGQLADTAVIARAPRTAR